MEESYVAVREIYTQLNDEINLAHTASTLAQFFTKQNNYANAEQFYEEARRLYTKLGDKVSLAENLWNTGWLYVAQKRYKEAETAVFESSILFKELALEERLSDCNEFLEAVKMEYCSDPDN